LEAKPSAASSLTRFASLGVFHWEDPCPNHPLSDILLAAATLVRSCCGSLISLGFSVLRVQIETKDN